MPAIQDGQVVPGASRMGRYRPCKPVTTRIHKFSTSRFAAKRKQAQQTIFDSTQDSLIGTHRAKRLGQINVCLWDMIFARAAQKENRPFCFLKSFKGGIRISGGTALI